MKEFFKKNKYEFISVCALLVLTTLFLYNFMQLWRADINVPFSYFCGDDMSILANAKAMIEQGWNMTADRLGAPYVADYYNFSTSVLHNVDLVTLKVFTMITKDAAMSANLVYLSVVYICALVSYFVMRECKLTNWIAVGGSLVFAFSPFIFIRGIVHIVLTTCYFVPLSILLCIWIYERDDVFAWNKNFFKNPRNYFAILFTFLIANNGIAYYPFFTCFILLVTGISKLIKTRKLNYLGKAFAMIGSIVAFMMVAMIPIFIHLAKYGKDADELVRAGFSDSELYGLKIIQLLLPVNGHGSYTLTKLINDYAEQAPLVNENISSYIGFMGIAGFAILLVVLFIKKKSALYERLYLLSELNLGMVLLGTIGGFGSIFALFISDMIRGYNRISIFIEYVCILAFCMVLNHLYKKAAFRRKIVIIAAGCLFTAFVIYEQFPYEYVPAYEYCDSRYTSDEHFVQQIEDSVDEGSMIYQLPYHQYPEGGSENDMSDYSLYTGYIHSKTLRWSYGTMRGSEGDKWNEKVSAMDLEDMVQYLKESGFAGIYIDRRAYEEDDLKALEAHLTEIIGAEPIVSENENLSFFNFTN